MMQAAANMRKRLEGVPRSGWTSLVVTDIEGYSGEEPGITEDNGQRQQHTAHLQDAHMPVSMSQRHLFYWGQAAGMGCCCCGLCWGCCGLAQACAAAVAPGCAKTRVLLHFSLLLCCPLLRPALVSSLPIDVMHEAMGTHNSIMRKAAWQHYGFVIGQEGDSFIVAFRAALDAVSFCLQVTVGRWVFAASQEGFLDVLSSCNLRYLECSTGRARHLGYQAQCCFHFMRHVWCSRRSSMQHACLVLVWHAIAFNAYEWLQHQHDC
jgi:hypothetical protein